jgi:hypothetical protein
MKWLLHSHREAEYASVVWRQSTCMKQVSFAVRKPSLGQRIELTGRVRQLTLDNEFLRAGDISDQVTASLAELLVRKLYVEWGLAAIEGLKIDDEEASTIALIERGPEELVDEIIAAIKAETGLTEDERKNS